MSFDISALRRADRIIGISAIALFICVFFFHWLGFSSSTPLGGVSAGADGWNSFHVSRWIWLLTIIVAVLSVAVAAGAVKLRSPVQMSVVVAGLGALSTVLILYRIIHHPSGGSSEAFGSVHVSYSYGIKIGIWLGLIAALGITYGGYQAMKDEGTSLSDVREQASAAVAGMSSQSPSASGGSSSPVAPSAPSVPPPASPAAPAEGSGPPIPPPAAPPEQT